MPTISSHFLQKGKSVVCTMLLLGLAGCGTSSPGGSQTFIEKQPEYRAAVAGDPNAQYAVAVYFLRFNDLSGGCSQKKGLMWLKRAAAAGQPDAMQLLQDPKFVQLAAPLQTLNCKD